MLNWQRKKLLSFRGYDFFLLLLDRSCNITELYYISGDRALDLNTNQKHGGFDVTVSIFSWGHPLTTAHA